MIKSARAARVVFAGTAVLALAACDGTPLDFDLRGLGGGFTTADAAVKATANRPSPDSRGVISYPTYQVAVAKRGDTINDVASRLGVDATTVARYNGVEADVPLRKGEVIALPERVEATNITPSTFDVTTLAGNAIESAPATTPVQTTALPASKADSGVEPIRHRVERGETAFTIARLYQVSAKSLAEWNGLGSDFAVREGQFLLVPVARQNPPTAEPLLASPATTAPGQGSVTPTPPSATQPLPKETILPAAAPPKKAAAPVADVGQQTKAAPKGRLAYPVQGQIIREYAKGKNEGINIKAAPGTAVKAADTGTVAAITKSGEGVPIVVVRHADNLLTVYANVTDVQVKKGDSVSRGQSLAKLRPGSDAYVHFEVRNGFDSEDPKPYLE